MILTDGAVPTIRKKPKTPAATSDQLTRDSSVNRDRKRVSRNIMLIIKSFL